jgi:hypothetical protein
VSFHVPEKYRVRSGRLATAREVHGNNGAFKVTLRHEQKLFVIASDMMGWEHVSASREDRCPTWDEMCQVKDMFWGDDDCVIQFHPPKSEYVNMHPNCLHLWRSTDGDMKIPDAILVGIKDAA